MESSWKLLGIEPTADESAIRKAYAALVRQYHPESHPEEFARVREAYEHARHEARYLKWRQETETDAVPAVPVDAAELATEAIMTGVVADSQPVVESVLQRSQPQEAPVVHPLDESVLFEPQAAIEKLGQCFGQNGEMAAVALLHQQLAQADQATIDARLDYEWLLLRSLLLSDTPPLALVFEGERCFRWGERPGEIARQFGDNGERRLGLLQEMADQYVFARHYAHNPWLARLFARHSTRAPWFGMTSLLLGVRHAAIRWREMCAAGELTPSLEYLNPVVQRRISGLVLMSSDVLVAMLAAWLVVSAFHENAHFVRQPWLGTMLWTGCTVLVMALCVACRWIWQHPGADKLKKLKNWLTGSRLYAFAITIFVVFFMGIVYSGSENVLWQRVLAGLALVLLGLSFSTGLLWLGWKIMAGLEFMVSRWWLGLMWEICLKAFRDMRSKSSGSWTGPGLLQKTRALPSACMSARAAKKRQRKEEAERWKRQNPFAEEPSVFARYPWLIWLGVMVLFQVAKQFSK